MHKYSRHTKKESKQPITFRSDIKLHQATSSSINLYHDELTFFVNLFLK